MTKAVTWREGMLRAMKHQVPCAFMCLAAMRGRCQDTYEAAGGEQLLICRGVE